MTTYENMVAIHSERTRDAETDAHTADAIDENPFEPVEVTLEAFLDAPYNFICPSDEKQTELLTALHEQLTKTFRHLEFYARFSSDDTSTMSAAYIVHAAIFELGRIVINCAKAEGVYLNKETETLYQEAK